MNPTLLIAEDEELVRRDMVATLKPLWPQVKILEAENGLQALDLLAAHQPQAAFLDIRMPGANGLEVARAASGHCHVVFCTAYDEYALKAFRNNGVAYVQKPVEEDELKEAMEKARKMLSPQENITRLLAMLQPQTPKYRERFLIPKGDQFQIVNSFSISHFDVDGKNTIAYLEDGTSVHISESMNELEAELDPKMFFRCSRQHIINIEDIVKMESTWNAKLILRLRRYPEKDFEVSRDRVKELKEKLNQ